MVYSALLIRELQLWFQAVMFLTSRDSFYNIFLQNGDRDDVHSTTKRPKACRLSEPMA